MDTTKLIFFLFAAIVCGVGAALSKNQRRYFLLLLVLFAPLSSAIIFYKLNGIMLMDFPLIVLLILGFSSNKKFSFYISKVSLPALGIVVWGLISAFNATDTGLAISEWTRVLRAYLTFLCIVNYTKTRADIQTVVGGLFAGLAFQSLLGVYQWRYGPLGLTFLEEIGYSWRSAGTFIHPAMFGDYLILLLPLVFRLFMFYKQQEKIYVRFYGVLFFLGIGALLGSYARGPWICFGGSIIIMFIFSIHRKRFQPKMKGILALLVLFFIIFILHYGSTIKEQFVDENRQGSAHVRIPLNKVAMRIIKDHSFLGTGLGNYTLLTPQYAHLEATREHSYRDLLQHVHNSYLLIAAETGIPGLLCFIGFIISLFRYGIKVVRSKNAYISNLGIGILTGCFAVLIAFLAGPDYRCHQILIMFWLIGGFIVALGRLRIRIPQPKIPRQSMEGMNVDTGEELTQLKQEKKTLYPI